MDADMAGEMQQDREEAAREEAAHREAQAGLRALAERDEEYARELDERGASRWGESW